MEFKKIYVALKNEGTKVWRPILAEKLEENIYKIKEYFIYDSEDEELEFLPGEIVICKMENLSGENVLVATERM
ncbi:MAG TPA: hypothetical protein PK511_10750 [Chitinophagales bacterium]|nr:hypothetical protein [Chitinophagales bacterium]HNI54993.1 hypothetical protein [Chitinophagales bacterium]HNJ89746.1 hypothetical protein [Chitinophagales bacterium]HNM09110.1 hypothetical protein [Chitinophagales bacterium]HNM30583.1 hypothetical protein [Chitinophagales bacterium]